MGRSLPSRRLGRPRTQRPQPNGFRRCHQVPSAIAAPNPSPRLWLKPSHVRPGTGLSASVTVLASSALRRKQSGQSPHATRPQPGNGSRPDPSLQKPKRNCKPPLSEQFEGSRDAIDESHVTTMNPPIPRFFSLSPRGTSGERRGLLEPGLSMADEPKPFCI